MRETVLGESVRRNANLSKDVVDSLIGDLKPITLQDTLVWAEHCTECVWPSCYSNCSLYVPRSDLKCRRFLHGVENVHMRASHHEKFSGISISFGKWAKLEARGRITLTDRRNARWLDRLDYAVSRAIDAVPVSFSRKLKIVTRWNNFKKDLRPNPEIVSHTDVLAINCYSEADVAIPFMIRLMNITANSAGLFEEKFLIVPGRNTIALEVSQIARFVDLQKDVRVQLEPAVQPPPRNTIIFSALGFVRLADSAKVSDSISSKRAGELPSSYLASSTRLVKCVVWDLDNTIWAGTLVENGIEGVSLRQPVAEVIAELDQRGVLQSIASKNNKDEAIAALKRFGLDSYFLYPQIHWYPKSQSLKQIAGYLNINLDSFVFVDDEQFEREEVTFAHPMIRAVTPSDVRTFLLQPEFNLPITNESRRRRTLYKEEEQRIKAFTNTSGDFLQFLRACELKLELHDITTSTIERVFELTQRTNQLNYRGRRMPRVDLEKLLRAEGELRGIVLSCRDRFGDYGIIGFVVLNSIRWTIEDFFMSCRVQRRKVEQALIAHLWQLAVSQGSDGVKVFYRRSKRNFPAIQVLQEINFQRIEGDDEEGLFAATSKIRDWDVVRVEDHLTAIRTSAAVE
jgi:FkbH-like protein